MGTGEAVLPVGLADMAPGPELGVALSTVDYTVLTGAQLAVVLAAEARQVAHYQARQLAAAVELGRIPWDGPGPVTREQVDEFSSDQVAFTLTMSRWSAARMLDLGQCLLDGLPMVFDALRAGRIDYPRALAFSQVLTHLDDDTARAIATALLGKAERWTSGQLRDRLAYRAHKADPTLARRRYRRGVTDRRVFIGLDDEGTARLSGMNLPVDRAAAAENRLERLARAAKADGDVRTLDQLRADAMLDSLAGVPFQLRPGHDPYTADADEEARRDGRPYDYSRGGPDSLHAAAAASNGPTSNGPTSNGPTSSSPTSNGPTSGGAASRGAASGGVGDAGRCVCGGVRSAERRGVVDLTVSLTTLLHLDDNPGWIPGWGPVLADIVRQVTFDQQANPAWRFSVTNDAGQLLHHGHTQRRPHATERAFVQARDGTCQAPGCRRPAMRCDVDHRQDHARGGPSHRGNGCSECRHHHRLKHEKDFVVHALNPSGFLWEARDGRLYFVPAEGNIVAIDNAPHETGWDLDQARPPREVSQIIPA